MSFLTERVYRLLSPFHHLTIEASNLAVAEDTLPTIDLKAYARRGAEARIAELAAELNDIYRAFPDLRRGSPRSATATTLSVLGVLRPPTRIKFGEQKYRME